MSRRLLVLMASAFAALCVAVSAGAHLAAPSQRVTIFARPTVVGWTEAALLYGTASGAGPQDVVKVEMKECGSTVYRAVVEAHVLSGGGWSAPVAPSVTATVRAVWKRTASPSVTIRQEAWITLERRRSGAGFVASVTSKRSLWRRVVEIQRRSGSTWRTVKRVRLTDSVHSTGSVSASEVSFALPVPPGTRLRAVLPSEQARPCYTRSVSRVVRT